MDSSIEDRFRASLRALQATETILEQEVKNHELSYSGLKDIDTFFKLINIKFKIALQLIENLQGEQEGSTRQRIKSLAQEKSRQAVQLMEDIVSENISLDQKNLITGAEGYRQAKTLFQRLLLQGGGAFFESELVDKHNARLIAGTIAGAIRKYSAPDDRYVQLFKAERLPKTLRKLVNVFFHAFVPENQQAPPYGIEEGEEVTKLSENILLPVSQAIYYLEQDVLPHLELELQENPGSVHLQRQIYSARQKIAAYKQLKFFPRSTPIVMEKGFYTDWWTGYTADGEILVRVALPVRFKSGTNLERMQELVRAEITRKLAGRGICPALDKEYYYLRSLESGKRGSSRLPGFKINTIKGFRALKYQFPFLAQLEDKRSFKRLIDLVRQRGRGTVRRMLEHKILSDESSFKRLT